MKILTKFIKMGCKCDKTNLQDDKEIQKRNESDDNIRQIKEKKLFLDEDVYNNKENRERSPESNHLSDPRIQIFNKETGQESDGRNKYSKYDDYPQKMLELINRIREDPVSYANIIEESINNIMETPDKEDINKTKIIFCKKVKVALFRGEPAFREAIDQLRLMSPLPPLTFKEEICIPLPDTEEEMKDSSFLKEQVRKIKENNNIDMFYKDLIKVAEVSALLMVVDDNKRNICKKRKAILNEEFKYIGITSKFINKTFIAYFSFSK